jgi:hypothetical protein
MNVRLSCYGTNKRKPTEPDNITRDNKKGTWMLRAVAIAGDRKVIKKKVDKILKYKDLIIEIQSMCNVKAKVIPVIKGTNGTILLSLRQYLNNITEKHEINKLQKTAILGTARVLRNVLMYNYKTYFTSEITLRVAQTVNKEQLQHYIP